MPNTYFQFKQFTVHQERCAMKVGTDGVLLGAWADCSSARSILDIGTGTGLLALMLAQRSSARITTVEIEKNAFQQATENVFNSPWKDRIRVVHTSAQAFSCSSKYDLIVSNPPYFSNSLKTSSNEKTIARHNYLLPHHTLLQRTVELLSDNGRFCLILPKLDSDTFIRLSESNKLYVNRLTNVIPTPGKEPKRCLIEFSKVELAIKEDELIIETGKRHEYSHKYLELTKDFYL